MSVPVFEQDTTVQFTWVSSVAPDSAPVFSVTDGLTDTVVDSFSSVQSNSTNYYALFTMPNSNGFFIGQWTAVKTFQGSARNFISRFVFKTSEVDV